MKITRWMGVLMLALGASCTNTASRSTTTAVSEGISPEADRLFKEACDFLRAQESFILEGERNEEFIRLDGQKILFTAGVRATVRRPGELHTEVSVPGRSRLCAFTGGTAVVWDTAEKTVTRFSGPDTIDGLVDYLAYEHGIRLALIDLIVADPYNSAMDSVVAGDYVGKAEVNGVLCNHLAFRGGSIDWQIWIDAGPRPIPRRLAITYREDEGTPSTILTDLKWTFSPAVSDGTFKAAVPDGFTEITPAEFRAQWLYAPQEAR